MQDLNELQTDALTEIINIGMGTAAAALSEMVDEEIILSVPTISFTTREHAAENINNGTNCEMTGVAQTFSGNINGNAILFFPEDKSLEIVKLLLKETVPLDDLSDMEQEALSEVGNIILNAGLSILSNFMEVDLTSSLPVYSTGSCIEIMNNCSNVREQGLVLFVHVDFGIKSSEISGYVAFLLDLSSFRSLTKSIDNHLAVLIQAAG